MKKLFFATGIVIVLIGVFIAVSYGSSTTSTHTKVASGGYDLWQSSAYYKAGEYVQVYCVPPKNWSNGGWDIDDTIPYSHRHIWFYIDDPSNSTTEFNTAWTEYDPVTQKEITLSRCYINVTIRGTDLNVTDQYPFYIGGTALVDGNYTVRVDPDMEPSIEYPSTPPNWLGLEKTYTEVVYPNGYLLPLGTTVGVVGAVISVKAGTSKKKTQTRKT
jgi:hypothetical protein